MYAAGSAGSPAAELRHADTNWAARLNTWERQQDALMYVSRDRHKRTLTAPPQFLQNRNTSGL